MKRGLDAHQMPPMKKCITKYGIWCTLIGELRWNKERMHYTFHMVAFQQLYMIAWVCTKLTARWVPKSLSDEQMATRASVYSALLKRFRSKEADFLSRLVTVDETWVHYYEPENKAQSRQSRQSAGRGLRGQRSSKRNPLLAR